MISAAMAPLREIDMIGVSGTSLGEWTIIASLLSIGLFPILFWASCACCEKSKAEGAPAPRPTNTSSVGQQTGTRKSVKSGSVKATLSGTKSGGSPSLKKEKKSEKKDAKVGKRNERETSDQSHSGLSPPPDLRFDNTCTMSRSRSSNPYRKFPEKNKTEPQKPASPFRTVEKSKLPEKAKLISPRVVQSPKSEKLKLEKPKSVIEPLKLPAVKEKVKMSSTSISAKVWLPPIELVPTVEPDAGKQVVIASASVELSPEKKIPSRKSRKKKRSTESRTGRSGERR